MRLLFYGLHGACTQLSILMRATQKVLFFFAPERQQHSMRTKPLHKSQHFMHLRANAAERHFLSLS